MKLRLKYPGNGYSKSDSLLLYWSLIINGSYIEQINRPSLFWDVMWLRIVVSYIRFGVTCQSHSQESSILRIMVEFPRNTLEDKRPQIHGVPTLTLYKQKEICFI
jgi:hypothetical protein